MHDAAKRARFESLRQRAEDGKLSEAEQAELTQMIEEIENAEADYLRPATERLQAERAEVEAQNAAVQKLLRRKEELARRLEQTLVEVKAERRAIEEELTRILGRSAAPSS